MNISNMMNQNIASLRQAIGMANLRNVMNQSQESVNTLMKGMEEANRKTMELSVEPHRGSNVNIQL